MPARCGFKIRRAGEPNQKPTMSIYKRMSAEELLAARRQAMKFLPQKRLESLPTCRNCNGAGYLVVGAGHFGDQSGDAGQLKAVHNECPRCCGSGKEGA